MSTRLVTLMAAIVLVSSALTPRWVGAQTPDGERIEALRSRLGPSAELKLTQVRLVESPRVTALGLQLSTPVAAPESAAALIPWNQVDRVGSNVSLAGRGAIVGGLLGAVALGAIAGAVSSELGMFPSYEVEPGAVAGGAFIGGLAGAGLGALLASPLKRWGTIYRGHGTPDASVRGTLAKRISGQPVRVSTDFIVANPAIATDGIGGNLAAAAHPETDNVHLAWPAIDRVEVRGRSHVPAILVGAAVGATLGLAVTSSVHFEPRDAQYVIAGGALAGTSVGWMRSAQHGHWTEVYRRDGP